MAFLLQSQTSGCCSTPNPPEQTATAEGVIYFPLLQPAIPPYQNPVCNGGSGSIPFYQQAFNGGNIYPIDVDLGTQINFYFKVRIRSADGCYQNDTYLNPNNRLALSGKGIKVRYPTGKPYTIEAWAQICPYCVPCWFVPGEIGSPEWYCKFAGNDNLPQIFGFNNPFNSTLHPNIVSVINFAFAHSGNTFGTEEAKFKYNGNIPFGTNVL